MIACKTKQEATDLIRFCVKRGAIVYGKHFREELANERLSLVDAYHLLINGNVFMSPEEDLRTGEWKYRIEGREPDGKKLAIVFCFKENERGFLITIFSLER